RPAPGRALPGRGRPADDLDRSRARPGLSRSAALPGFFPSVIVGVMSEATRLLNAIDDGDPHAAEQLLPLIYDELRRLAAQKLAQEKPEQTLQAARTGRGNRPCPSVPGSPIARPERLAEVTGQEGTSTARRDSRDGR